LPRVSNRLSHRLSGQERVSHIVNAESEDDEESEQPRKLEVSNNVKLREEVANPFGKVRLYGSGVLAGNALVASLIAAIQLFASVAGAPNAKPVADNAQTFGIDVACLGALTWYCLREKGLADKRLQKFAREEMLGELGLELPNGNRRQLQDFQGFARPILISATEEKLAEAMAAAEPYREALSNRSVIVVPITYGAEDKKLDWETWRQGALKKEKPFMVKPVGPTRWNDWMKDQKKEAKVDESTPVWMSLRKDGRVRSSGKGMPPWANLAASLPPDGGAFGGFLDGMDGSVGFGSR
jgi:hypothetical protein